MHPSVFFLPTFLEAVRSNTEESFRSIMTEPIPGVYSFAMLQPTFCEMLLEEVWYIKDKNKICFKLCSSISNFVHLCR